MINIRTLTLISIIFIVAFSLQRQYFPETLSPPTPEDASIALEPPRFIPRPVVTPVQKELIVEPEIEEIEEETPTEIEPPIEFTLRDLLQNGTRNINHYRYDVYRTESPYTVDITGSKMLIRYKNRLFVPVLMIDRVFIDHDTKTATATCVTDWLCARSGSYYETITVNYDLFNIPTVYDQLGQYLDLEVVKTEQYTYVDRRQVMRAELSNKHSVLYLSDIQFPVGMLDDLNRTTFASTHVSVNTKTDLNLFSYTKKDTSTNVFFPESP